MLDVPHPRRKATPVDSSAFEVAGGWQVSMLYRHPHISFEDDINKLVAFQLARQVETS